MIRRATHTERLRLAKEICQEVKDALGDDLKAFVIFASTAKNQDGPYSDLELMAVVTDDYKKDACGFMRDDVYCEVYYEPFSKALKDAAEVDTDWPIAADQWHRMMPIYIREGDDCLDQIRTAAQEVLKDEAKFRKCAGEVMGEVQEEYASLMNAWERKVASDILTQLFHFSSSVLRLVGVVNHYFYQSYRNAWEESKELAELPKNYVDLIELVHGEVETSLQNRYNAALELWQNIEIWMAEQGIEWTRSDLKLPKKEA